MRVVNECRVNFEYRLSDESPIVMDTSFSNRVSTDIVKDVLSVNKLVNKASTYAFDIITYNIIIKNISDFIATNVFFRDKIPIGTIFIENSVEINNKKKRWISPNNGFYIKSINPRCSVDIKFKVRVLPICFCEVIKNCSSIYHDHIYNIEKEPARLCIPSNFVYTKVKNKIFKELNIENIINLKKDIHDIVNFSASLKILDTKRVDTPINNIYKKEKSSICTLIVIGVIEYKILFKSKKQKSRGSLKTIKSISGFSCNIIAPVGITYLEQNTIKSNINYSCAKLITRNTILTSTNIILNFSENIEQNNQNPRE